MHKMAIFVYGTLLSNNCIYEKQMFLFNDNLYTLLFRCVIIVNPEIHININANRINCISSSDNNTPNTPITESASKSISKSKNEPTHRPIYALIIAQSVSSIQPPKISINTSCNGLITFEMNAVNLATRSGHYIYTFMNDIMIVNVNLQMTEFYQPVMPDFCVLYVFNALCILCKIVLVFSF